MPDRRPPYSSLPPDPLDDSRRRRDIYITLVTAAVFLGFLVVETLLPEVGNSSSFTGNITFFLLINLNLILLGLLVFLVIRNFVRLVVDRRRGIFGSHLRTRLVVSFIGLALIPSTFLFFVAQRFLGAAFENWFNVRISGILKDTREVTQSYYQFAADNASYFSNEIALEIADRGLLAPNRSASLGQLVSEKRRELNVASIEILDGSGEQRARAETEEFRNDPPPQATSLPPALVRGERSAETIRYGKADIVRVGAPIRGEGGRIAGAVLIDYFVPKSISRKTRRASRLYEEYRLLSGMKEPIETQYTMTLALITLVIVFLASWVGFQQAKQITVPLQRLEEGTREVAQGNWSYRIDATGDPESALLVDSFNQMTADLQKTNNELTERRSYVESILSNISAGVVSFDSLGHTTTVNPAAETMLGLRASQIRGRHWRDTFQRADLTVLGDLLAQLAEAPRREVEKQVRLTGGEVPLTALASATALFDTEGRPRGTILFLENVTHLQRVQRMEAWREVARRLAHEIKNPLTPIQLSAQRLRKRYDALLQQEEGALLDECTRTIVSQVDELKRLVGEFSSFARLPAVEPIPRDLNAVVAEAVALYREGHPEIEFTAEYDNALPPVDLDRDAIKRVIVNMLDNAVSACRAVPDRQPRIGVSTHYDSNTDAARLEIADNGVGIKPETKLRLFEPYFSTKRDGTGLGLAIVSSVVADHHGYVRVYDNRPHGTRFVITLPPSSRHQPTAA